MGEAAARRRGGWCRSFSPGFQIIFEAGGVGSSCHNYNALWFDVEKRQGQGSLDISKNFFIRPRQHNISFKRMLSSYWAIKMRTWLQIQLVISSSVKPYRTNQPLRPSEVVYRYVESVWFQKYDNDTWVQQSSRVLRSCRCYTVGCFWPLAPNSKRSCNDSAYDNKYYLLLFFSIGLYVYYI